MLIEHDQETALYRVTLDCGCWFEMSHEYVGDLVKLGDYAGGTVDGFAWLVAERHVHGEVAAKLRVTFHRTRRAHDPRETLVLQVEPGIVRELEVRP